MADRNTQEARWEGAFGDAYTERNFTYDPENQKKVRKVFFDKFETFDRNLSILEIGCSTGINLEILTLMGFTNLGGIDIHKPAIDEAKNRLPEADLRVGTVLDMPFEDNSFDIVFSSGVLIHQHPDNSLKTVMSEMLRCGKKWILGLEDYTEQFSSIGYQGLTDAYWSGPFLQTFLEVDNSLEASSQLCDATDVGNSDQRKRQIYKIKL